MKNIVRMRFAKTGRARYISHLDLIRCFQRAVCRAKLPAAYSEGFHPHMQTSFATTLPLGFFSTAEQMDLELTEELPCDAVMERLNAVLPEGIRGLEAWKGALAVKVVVLKRMLEVTGDESLLDALELRLCLPAGSTANLNPMLLLETWKKQTEQTWASPEICRTELLTEEKQKFF